jgi:outer membrane protein OmpA-like peptidoglycan-associated protein
MKKCILLIALFSTTIINSSIAQSDKIVPLVKGIYLVVGSFQNKTNAVKFRNKLEIKGRDAHISFSDQTMYYYVYIQTFNTVDEAIPMVKPTREKTSFKDAWVLAYSVNSGMTAISTIPTNNNDTPDPVNTTNTIETNVVSPAILSSDKVDEKTSVEKAEAQPYTAEKFKNEKNQYKFNFNTYNSVTKSKIIGSINVIDPDRLKLVRSVKTQEVTFINDPHNQSNSLEFIAEIFGYKKAQHDINLNAEIEGDLAAFMRVNEGVLTVDFPLKRSDKGEVIVMYNVFFYKDAAVMKPVSQFELNSLLDLLNEKKEYNIRISGHTNGNASGKIIEIDSEIPEYFSLSKATKEGNGSAKKLSLKRAEIIQKYLLNNGIDANRMEVKGYGGKSPIYEKFDRLASKNVRVEIEILQK